MRKAVGVGLILLLGASLRAELAIVLGEITRRTENDPKGLSGITYAGGENYYVVADNGAECGLYAATIQLAADGLSITNYTIGARIALVGTSDIEGVAYDPATGNLWVADEGTGDIREYAPTGGAALRRVELPSVMRKNVGNFGLEALTISGDGLTMWTANEEALTVDGERSSPESGTTVRLVKFERATVHEDWVLAAMYAYTTDKWNQPKATMGSERRGVSDLCALPDGSLLVLERELSSNTWLLSSKFFFSIYRVSAAAQAAATDVHGIAGLAATAGWTAVEKTLLYTATSTKQTLTNYSNFEGLCLGPRLADGQCALVMVADAGDGNTVADMRSLALSGMDVRTLDFMRPSVGRSTLEGANYRFQTGSQVRVALCGDAVEPSAYTNNGAARVTGAAWRLPAHTPSSGEGLVASFTVATDDTLTWTVQTTAAVSATIGNDSFEHHLPGARTRSLEGWTGFGSVETAAYAPANPPGYPMQRESHRQVLEVEDAASRSYASTEDVRQQMDFMVRVRRVETLPPLAADSQGAVVAGPDGLLYFGGMGADGSAAWTVLDAKAYENGAWARLSLDFDYTASVPTCAVWVDGEPCGRFPLQGAKRRVSRVDFAGSIALDDVIFTDGTPNFEISAPSDAAASVKVPSVWYARHGLAWNPNADADGDGLSARQEYLAGSDPNDAESGFTIRGLSVEGDVVTVRFSGDLPDVSRLVVEGCADLSGDWHSLTDGELTRQNGEYIWRKSIPPSKATFFRAFIRE